jgi:hypothetical protein
MDYIFYLLATLILIAMGIFFYRFNDVALSYLKMANKEEYADELYEKASLVASQHDRGSEECQQLYTKYQHKLSLKEKELDNFKKDVFVWLFAPRENLYQSYKDLQDTVSLNIMIVNLVETRAYPAI